MNPSPSTHLNTRARWLAFVREAIHGNQVASLTLGDYRGPDKTLKRVLVRPVMLRAGFHLSFVFRHKTRDITKNLAPEEGLTKIEALFGSEFFSGHLATPARTIDARLKNEGAGKVTIGPARADVVVSDAHDREKKREVSVSHAGWLRGLGVTTADGKVAQGMEAKFRQIHRFVELLQPLIASLPQDPGRPLEVVDMGCGKGYLTFAACEFLKRSAHSGAVVRGIESREALVDLCNRVAMENGFKHLTFEAGTIADAVVERADVVIALHACDTATDDAIAKGIRADASLIVVAPCCHHELRPQIKSPPVLAPALGHGILLDRQSEFVTDALRAGLLEWAGYETRVFEFISPEHTNKNLMITATKRPHSDGLDRAAGHVRELAAFYGIQHQRLAHLLDFDLSGAGQSNAGHGR